MRLDEGKGIEEVSGSGCGSPCRGALDTEAEAATLVRNSAGLEARCEGEGGGNEGGGQGLLIGQEMARIDGFDCPQSREKFSATNAVVKGQRKKKGSRHSDVMGGPRLSV